MKRIVDKPERVALCRRCQGTGRRVAGDIGEPQQSLHTTAGHRPTFPTLVEELKDCPQCEGSGRVRVSCKMELDIKPYKEV